MIFLLESARIQENFSLGLLTMLFYTFQFIYQTNDNLNQLIDVLNLENSMFMIKYQHCESVFSYISSLGRKNSFILLLQDNEA